MQQKINPVAGIFSYSIGICSVALMPALPSTPIIALIGILTVILTTIVLLSSRVLWPIATILLGMTLGLSYGKWLEATAFPAELEKKPLVIEGKVVGLPIITTSSSRFEFRVIGGEFKQMIKNVRINWFAAPTIQAGQHWRLSVKLKKPHGFASPGTFDFEAWAAREGVQAMGYVTSGHLLSPSTQTASLRQRLYNWLMSSTPLGSIGVLKALLLGDKSGITDTQWLQLNATGTTHLVVISGLHIGLMALIGYWLTLLFARIGLLPLQYIPLPRMAAGLSLLFAILYASLAGFGVPVQRALVMTFVATAGPIFGLRPSPVTLLVVALAAVLTLDPLAVTGTGFWYSFMAVAALIFALSGRYGSMSIAKKLIKPQWAVFCVLTPMLIFNDQPVSLFSPLINLVAIPFIGLLIVPLLLIAATLSELYTPLANGILSVIDPLLHWFFLTLECFSNLLITLPANSSPSVFAVLMAVLGGLLLISPLPFYLKTLSPFLLLPWLFPNSSAPNHGHAHVTVLDVGQGQAVLIRTRHHTLIYDTGDAFSESFNAADRVIVPCLRHYGIDTIDKIIISHGDKDHSGGLRPLLKHYYCPYIACGTSIAGMKHSILKCTAGQNWQWDGVNFQVLAGGGRWKKTNDRSCVLKVTAGNESALLAGDIGQRVEAQLIASGQPLKATVLLAPHHGSRYSNSANFLRAVNPQSVLFSSGHKNQFGHPAKATLKRVSYQGAKYWNTAWHGSLAFVLGNSNCDISAYRLTHRRYWWHDSL